MSYFITKYALTEGIQEISKVGMTVEGNMLFNTTKGIFFHGHGKDWHMTMESAVKRAEEMRKAKIVSLKKSITKMEKLDFTKVKS